MESWRIYVIVILLLFSVADLALTYHYVYKYKQWQPEKEYNLIEQNPLLVFLWNTFGLHLGMFIGSIAILSLIYIIARTAHPVVVFLLFLFLSYALFTHYKNIVLIGKLIAKYPTGHLPIAIFGTVQGSNPK